MTIEEIASYCEIKDCTISFGNADSGLITVDGGGIVGKFNNYRRFLALNELSSLPDPGKVLGKADHFRLKSETQDITLNREEFEKSLTQFRELVNS